MNQINRIIFSSIILLALDFIYLSLSKDAFAAQIVKIQRVVMQVKIIPALMCYAFLIFGLNYFILRTHRPIFEAFLLGLVIYGVFDTTSYALFKKWDWELAVMDTLWGGVLLSLTTAIVYQF